MPSYSSDGFILESPVLISDAFGVWHQNKDWNNDTAALFNNRVGFTTIFKDSRESFTINL